MKKRLNTIWDYDLSKSDLNKPTVKKWYLERKIGAGDFSDLKKKDLITHLPDLNISPSMKKLIKNFLKDNA